MHTVGNQMIEPIVIPMALTSTIYSNTIYSCCNPRISPVYINTSSTLLKIRQDDMLHPQFTTVMKCNPLKKKTKKK